MIIYIGIGALVVFAVVMAVLTVIDCRESSKEESETNEMLHEHYGKDTL